MANDVQHRTLAIVSMAAVLGLPFAYNVAHAQNAAIPDHPMMRDRFFIGVGAVYADSDVVANLNSGRVGVGALVDFEEDLGLDENNLIGMATFRMRLSKRWHVDAEYFSINRDNERQAQRTIEWGDLDVPANVNVRASFKTQDLRVGVGYSIFRTQDKEVGFGLGAHIAKFEATLSTANFGSERASQSAPLPFLNFYARMALTDRWLLSVRVDRLSLDTGDIEGNIFSSGTDIVYQPWQHFSVGLGYRDIDIKVTSTDDKWRGDVSVQQSGPFLFIATTF